MLQAWLAMLAERLVSYSPLTETEKSKTLACINAEQGTRIESTKYGNGLPKISIAPLSSETYLEPLGMTICLPQPLRKLGPLE